MFESVGNCDRQLAGQCLQEVGLLCFEFESGVFCELNDSNCLALVDQRQEISAWNAFCQEQLIEALAFRCVVNLRVWLVLLRSVHVHQLPCSKGLSRGGSIQWNCLEIRPCTPAPVFERPFPRRIHTMELPFLP